MKLEVIFPSKGIVLDQLEIVKDKLLRNVAQTALVVLQDRVFTDQGGRKTDGTPIGTYTPEYLRFRAKNYGKTNRQINLNATSQMFQDLDIVPDGENYSVGFKNSFNADKARWNEERFGTIFQLSEDEIKDYIQPTVNEFIAKLFKQ
jgi:hypothetical protein